MKRKIANIVICGCVLGALAVSAVSLGGKADVNETVVKIPNRQVIVQEGNTFRLNKQTNQTIIIGTKMQRVYIYSHSFIHLFIHRLNYIPHLWYI